MAITLTEFLDRISASEAELYLMICSEIIVYDAVAKTVYIPESTHRNADLNPMGDFKTYLGHGLLWSQHIELQCTSAELSAALGAEGYNPTPYQANEKFQIYTIAKPAAALQKAV
jgi:hypothetical protein